METIPKKDCRKIGYIRKAHGIKGELILEFDPTFESTITEANRFFLEMEGLLVPYFISKEDVNSFNTAIITFKWVESKKYARRLVGSPVYLYLNEIKETDKYLEPLFLNYRLYNEKLEEIGLISEVDDFSGNIVLTVMSGKKKFLIPYNQELLLSFDRKQKTLILSLPEGLIFY